jgi:hypothetical protein
MRNQTAKEDMKDLTEWYKKLLGDKIEKMVHFRVSAAGLSVKGVECRVQVVGCRV